MPLAVANSVGELAARFRAERLRPVTGEESVAHSHPHFYNTPRYQSDRGVFLFLGVTGEGHPCAKIVCGDLVRAAVEAASDRSWNLELLGATPQRVRDRAESNARSH
jgi:hypothetical protein